MHDPDSLAVVTVDDKLLARTCDWCGADIELNSRGRHRRYCSRNCRQRSYEVRTAQRRQEDDRAAGTARAADEPVREVVERTVTRMHPLVAGRPRAETWLEPVEEPDEDPPRARELQRTLVQVAAEIAQGRMSQSEIDRILRGVEAVRSAADRHRAGPRH